MELDVAVIGAGLFGSIAARALADAGRSVTVFDDAQPEAGSLPAACLMRPSWLTSMGKPVVDASLELLDRLYGVQTLRFVTKPKLASVLVYWVPPSSILKASFVRKHKVTRLSKRGKGWALHFRSGSEVEAQTVVVAAGIWTSLLVPEVQQKGLAGMAFLWPQGKIDQPFIRLWAPYKQVVAFNRGDGLWIGDGSAVLRQNWTEAHAEKSLVRCASKLEIPPKRLFGIRPYHERKPCFVEQVKPNLWVATGGAKNGTLAAGWCAHEIVSKMT